MYESGRDNVKTNSNIWIHIFQYSVVDDALNLKIVGRELKSQNCKFIASRLNWLKSFKLWCCFKLSNTNKYNKSTTNLNEHDPEVKSQTTQQKIKLFTKEEQ